MFNYNPCFYRQNFFYNPYPQNHAYFPNNFYIQHYPYKLYYYPTYQFTHSVPVQSTSARPLHYSILRPEQSITPRASTNHLQDEINTLKKSLHNLNIQCGHLAYENIRLAQMLPAYQKNQDSPLRRPEESKPTHEQIELKDLRHAMEILKKDREEKGRYILTMEQTIAVIKEAANDTNASSDAALEIIRNHLLK